MFNWLKTIFSKERVNKQFNIEVQELINSTKNNINSDMDKVTRKKLQSLAVLNTQLNQGVEEMKSVAGELINKLNSQVDGLNKQITAISETASEGIMTLDYRGKIINANKSVVNMFGYSLSELTEFNISKIIPISIPELLEGRRDFCDLMQSVTLNIFNNLKYREGNMNVNNYFSLSKTNRRVIGETKDRKNIYLDMNVNIINPNVANYTNIQYICVMTNVTELVQTKKEIEELINFQLSLVEAIPNSVFWKDKNFKYLGCNSEFEQLTGFSREQIIGKTLTELVEIALHENVEFDETELKDGDELIAGEARIMAEVWECREKGLPLSSLKKVVAKNRIYNRLTGEFKDIIVYRSILVDENGDFDGIVCSIMDITKMIQQGILSPVE